MVAYANRGRPSLRAGFDREVYQVLKKLEDANDGKPFKSVTAVYDAIKRSNSSLARQKKRPLEDAIERALDFRKAELGDEEDSEADLDEPELESEEKQQDTFLLNRQLAKRWNVQNGSPVSSDARPEKKRRLQDDVDDNDGPVVAGDSTGPEVSAVAEKTGKGAPKKSLKATRFQVEQFSKPPPLAGFEEVWDMLVKNVRWAFTIEESPTDINWHDWPALLLSGPPGIGKKSLVKALAAEMEVSLISLAGCFDDPDRMEKSLHDAVDEAMRLAPSIIFIENLDCYMGKVTGTGLNEHQRRACREFSKNMERIRQSQPSDKPVLAMATTSRLTDIDPIVLRTPLFERTIQLSAPDHKARQDILALLTKNKNLAEDVDLNELATLTHGYVGADLVTLIRLARIGTSNRQVQTGQLLPEADTAMTNGGVAEISGLDQSITSTPKVLIELQDFQKVINGFTPALRKEGFTSIPDVTWEQVGALGAVRRQLDTSIIGPIKEPEIYKQFGLVSPAGVLLWGPPGCGKTLVAQAVANEAKASLIIVNGPELLNKYVGESERAVRDIFERARSCKPCILFFDEMDSIVPNRASSNTDSGVRVVNALLTELDGARDRSGIYVIGTTNRPDMMDPAILRPGRLSVRLFVDLPTDDERVDILRAICQTKLGRALSQPEIDLLAKVARDRRCKNFSGADLGGLQVKAAETALQRWKAKEKQEPVIDGDDWEHALASTRPSVANPEEYRRMEAKMRTSA